MGCDDDPNTEPEDIVIGTITTLTGALAPVGSGLRDAVQLAVNDVNAAGGLLGGRLVDLEVADDRTTAEGGTAAANAMVAAGAVGVIGGLASSSSLAAADVLGPAEIPQISGTSTSPALNFTGEGGDSHPYFFRTVPSDAFQGVVLANLAFGSYNAESDALDFACMNLGIINLDNDYGTPFRDAIVENFEGLGGSVAVQVGYTQGRPSYTSEVDDLIAGGSDCIAIVAYPDDAEIIIREYDNAGGPDVPWFGTDGIQNAEVLTSLGDLAEGLVGTAPASNRNRPEYTTFEQSFQTAFNEDPGVFAETVYDAAAVLILAIEQAGSTEGSAIREALFDVSRFSAGDEIYSPGEFVEALGAIQAGIPVDWEGAAGAVDFTDAGDVLEGLNYEVWTWTAGAFTSEHNVPITDLTD